MAKSDGRTTKVLPDTSRLGLLPSELVDRPSRAAAPVVDWLWGDLAGVFVTWF
ncbi:MAG: hypothetical protein R3C32_11095 [Chloroflexota bacterium]